MFTFWRHYQDNLFQSHRWQCWALLRAQNGCCQGFWLRQSEICFRRSEILFPDALWCRDAVISTGSMSCFNFYPLVLTVSNWLVLIQHTENMQPSNAGTPGVILHFFSILYYNGQYNQYHIIKHHTLYSDVHIEKGSDEIYLRLFIHRR